MGDPAAANIIKEPYINVNVEVMEGGRDLRHPGLSLAPTLILVGPLNQTVSTSHWEMDGAISPGLLD